jgi:hypothetical protein
LRRHRGAVVIDSASATRERYPAGITHCPQRCSVPAIPQAPLSMLMIDFSALTWSANRSHFAGSCARVPARCNAIAARTGDAIRWLKMSPSAVASSAAGRPA